MTQTEQTAQTSSAAKWRRRLVRLPLLILLILLMLALLPVWMLQTNSGSRAVLAAVGQLSGGAFTWSGLSGTLGDGLRLEQLSFHNRRLHLDGSGVRLQWQPWRLWQGSLQVAHLEAGSLRIATAPTPDIQATPLPADLNLPLSLEIQKLALGRLQIATLAPDGKQSDILALSDLGGSLDYRQGHYRIQAALTSPWGRLQLNSALAATRPFQLQGGLEWHSLAQSGLPVVQGSLSGSLQSLQLDLHTSEPQTGNALQGQAKAVFTPFAAQAIHSLQLDVEHLNPAAWQAGAAQADLRLHARLTPEAAAGGLVLAGVLDIGNTKPAALNRNGWPLQSLRTSLRWQGERIDLRNIDLRVAGRGQVDGNVQVAWTGGVIQAEAQLRLSGIDLRQIDQRLQTSDIAGTLQARSGAGHRVQMQAQLTDASRAQARLQAEASYQPAGALLSVSTLELRSKDARLQGQGEIAFGGAQHFRFKGSLANFDPARWLATPSGRLQAEFSTQGQLQPRLQLQLSLPQLQGQYAGQPLQGKLALRWWRDQRLQLQQLALQWGKNTLSAQGGWGGASDSLQLKLDAPELAALNPLTAPLQLVLGGSLKADASLQGPELAGTLTTQASQLRIGYRQNQLDIADLDGNLALASGSQGAFEGELSARHIGGELPGLPNAAPGGGDQLEQLSLKLSGKRDAHTLTLDALFPGQQKLHLQAGGGLQSGVKNKAGWSWDGQLQAFTLQGLRPNLQLRLQSPGQLQIAPQALRLGSMQLQSELGLLVLDSLEWSKDALTTQGRLSEMRVMALANLLKPQYAVDGNLKVDAQWQLQLKDHVQGELRLQRHSGDLRISDIDGTGVPVPLGIRELQLQLQAGGPAPGVAGERLALNLTADGSRLGLWQVKASTVLSAQDGAWRVLPDAALQGQVTAAIPDLQWLGPWLNPGLALKGKLDVAAQLMGEAGKPRYQARLSGRELELAFASEGLLLPNGSLDAQLEDGRLKLNSLQFSSSVANLPRHSEFQGQNWMGQTGEFKASGEIDIGRETGSIQAQWREFPLLQRKDRWLLASGQASIVEANNIWSLNGQVKADGAYFKLPKLPPPSLSGDVVVTRKADVAARKNNGDAAPKKGLKTRIDVSFEMGPHFVFVGRGLDTGLAGSIRLRSSDGAPLQASGSIRTVGGVYEGYGQQLAIERGILNFQGSPANPALNIRALRQGLAVEAGVEVAGSVAAPQVRLVSEPSVPDAEKLSWLVLGRGSEQLAGSDASLLMSAASAIFGGDGSRNVPRDIVQGLGFDEFSIGAAGNGKASHLPGQTIAGNTGLGNGSTASGEQVVSIGKRLRPGLVLSVERGLSDASGAVKLSWQLTRRISVTGRTGSESAVDAYYTFSFH